MPPKHLARAGRAALAVTVIAVASALVLTTGVTVAGGEEEPDPPEAIEVPHEPAGNGTTAPADPPVAEPAARERIPTPAAAASPDEERILAALDGAGADLDELVERTGLAPGALRATLLRMRLHGAVEAAAGDRYHRKEETLGEGA